MTSSPSLSYVALVSRDVPAACGVLGGVLGLTRTDCALGGDTVPVFAVGDAALAVFEPGDPFVHETDRTGVHHIGLTVDDVDAATARLAAAGISARDAGRPGLAGGRHVELDPDATVGVRTCLVDPLTIDRSASPRIERIDHLGVASADNRKAISVFTDTLGLPIESQQTDMEVQTTVESFTSDKYGVVYHSRPPRPVGGLRVPRGGDRPWRIRHDPAGPGGDYQVHRNPRPGPASCRPEITGHQRDACRPR